MAKEYIDKNLTWKALDVAHLFDNGNPRHIAQQVVEEQPVADVAEVVHGEWEAYPTRHYKRCSVCKTEYYKLYNGFKGNYCPNCGAKMDGKKVE